MAFSWSALKRRSVLLAALYCGCGLFSRGVVCLWLWVPPGRTGLGLPLVCLRGQYWVRYSTFYIRLICPKIDLSILLERFPGVLFSTTVQDLGVTLDQELTLSRHVGSVCRSCFYHLRQIRSVRRSLTFKAVRTLMHAFICSRVDYFSAIYAGVALAHVDQLQSVLTRELIVL